MPTAASIYGETTAPRTKSEGKAGIPLSDRAASLKFTYAWLCWPFCVVLCRWHLFGGACLVGLVCKGDKV
jgi:hypothetical protein